MKISSASIFIFLALVGTFAGELLARESQPNLWSRIDKNSGEHKARLERWKREYGVSLHDLQATLEAGKLNLAQVRVALTNHNTNIMGNFCTRNRETIHDFARRVSDAKFPTWIEFRNALAGLNVLAGGGDENDESDAQVWGERILKTHERVVKDEIFRATLKDAPQSTIDEALIVLTMLESVDQSRESKAYIAGMRKKLRPAKED